MIHVYMNQCLIKNQKLYQQNLVQIFQRSDFLFILLRWVGNKNNNMQEYVAMIAAKKTIVIKTLNIKVESIVKYLSSMQGWLNCKLKMTRKWKGLWGITDIFSV